MGNAYIQKCWKELLNDSVGDILRLRGHTDGLRADVHREDLRSPNPDSGTPSRLVEEDEQEQQEHDRYSDRL